MLRVELKSAHGETHAASASAPWLTRNVRKLLWLKLTVNALSDMQLWLTLKL